MSRLVGRITSNFRTARTLLRTGVTFRSILLYPIRRRLSHPRNQIDLKNGISMASPVEEELLGLFAEIWTDRRYVPAGFDVAAGDTVVDIGANVGVFTLWAASRHPDVKVIAIEPSPRMCESLRRNISASGLRNVTIVQSASGGQTGEAVLYSRGAEAMNSLYCHDILGGTFLPVARTDVLTLDEVFDRYGVRTCLLSSIARARNTRSCLMPGQALLREFRKSRWNITSASMTTHRRNWYASWRPMDLKWRDFR